MPLERISILFNKILFCLLFCAFFLAKIVSANLVELEAAFLKGDYPQVKILAREILNNSSDKESYIKARYFLGISHLWLKEYPEAIEEFGKLTKETSDINFKDKSYLGLIDAYYLNEEYDKAWEAITELLKLNPNSDYLSLIYLKAARVNLKLAQWSEATDYLKKILSDYPKSLDANIAKQLLEEERFFAVQVGSFQDRKLAEDLAGQLKERGEYAYIVETSDLEKKKYFRVRVGKLSLLSEAKTLRSKLSEAGYPTTIYP